MITLLIAIGIWFLLEIIGMALVSIYDYYELGCTEVTVKDLFLVVAGPIILIFIICEILKEKGDKVIFRKERSKQNNH